jgi:hypothetical protein
MRKILSVAVPVLLLGWGVFMAGSKAAEGVPFQTYEYATIRWAGRENTHLIRPNGKVEFLGPILTKIPRPDRTDERAFYMNVAMNAAAKEGFEFAGMTHDEIVMKRPVSR